MVERALDQVMIVPMLNWETCSIVKQCFGGGESESSPCELIFHSDNTSEEEVVFFLEFSWAYVSCTPGRQGCSAGSDN